MGGLQRGRKLPLLVRKTDNNANTLHPMLLKYFKKENIGKKMAQKD